MVSLQGHMVSLGVHGGSDFSAIERLWLRAGSLLENMLSEHRVAVPC